MPSLTKPPAVPAEGTLGIVAPCSPVNEAALKRGLEALHRLGFKTVVGRHVLDRRGHHAGRVAERAADLHEMFERSDVHAVLCARGGSGSIRLLQHLDWDLIRSHPKPFLGFSDVTSIHMGMAKRAGLVSFFSPMVTSDFADPLGAECVETFRKLLCAPDPLGVYDEPRLAHTELILPGVAEGPLAGGTISLVAATIGTPYEIDTEGAILFFEDIHESPAKIERFLMQMHLAGKLECAAGFLIGSLRWDPDDEERARFLPFCEVIQDLLVPLGKPILGGWPSGHLPSPLTLPLGVRARLDADGRSLTLLEAAVR